MELKNRVKNLTFERFIYIILIIFSVIFLSYMIKLSESTKTNTDNIKKLEFIGTYQEDEQSVPKKMDINTDIDVRTGYNVIIKGHFNKDIPKNEQIIMYMMRMSVVIKQNGKEIYAYGLNENYHKTVRSIGTEWTFLNSPGISKNDDITIIMENIYPGMNSKSYNTFLKRLYIGEKYSLLQKGLKENSFGMVIGILILISGIVYLINIIVLRFTKVQMETGYLACGMILIFGAICTLINYDYITLIFENAFIINIIDYFLQMFIIEFVFIYLRMFIINKNLYKLCTNLIYIWSGFILIYFFFQGTGIKDIIEMVSVLIPSATILITISLGCLLIEHKRYNDFKVKLLLMSTILLGVSAILEIIHFYVVTIYWTFVFQFGLLIFAIIQFIIVIKHKTESILKAKNAEKIEQELIQNRISIMLSQIQPHFLYNSLTAISRLCDKDPKKAKQAIIEFSTYLRGNLNSLKEKDVIPFEKELEHVKTYLSLEKMRFEDELNIVYDIEIMDFFVPSLTIQPVVENAVKHGVGKKEDGGTVKITTREDDTEYIIVIEDDGIGFDVNEKKNDGKTHVGIENVRIRLKAQCNGSLDIKSNKGIGTIATISIPKGGE